MEQKILQELCKLPLSFLSASQIPVDYDATLPGGHNLQLG